MSNPFKIIGLRELSCEVFRLLVEPFCTVLARRGIFEIVAVLQVQRQVSQLNEDNCWWPEDANYFHDRTSEDS
jgi:hypothetical protein